MPVHHIHGGPTHCHNGHPLEYPTVTVGWTGCGCEQKHRTWTCNARDADGVRCGAVECHVTSARREQ